MLLFPLYFVLWRLHVWNTAVNDHGFSLPAMGEGFGILFCDPIVGIADKISLKNKFN